ncbi:hypothetical protein ACKUB1_15205 [Methanospirillum stamsii]|uniref:Uncharacterized protein n=1 Tax=Methanospirillum stamsii TaxID=1277351 RepID=A0A2V2NFU5_9EURY|nr:hypothetical protein [Methanospirillum stamsii]PWR75238.1 hypothetical protein DLD82_05460 [Methanospirillum stamsii]
MIPDINTRKFRPCEDCVFFNTQEEYCTLYENTIHPEQLDRWEYDDPLLPCIYNFSVDEIMDLINNSENSKEKLLKNSIWQAR